VTQPTEKPPRLRSFGALLALALVLVLGVGTAFAANLSGDGTFVGTSGNDNINAANGNDTIYGLGGSDSINAGTGNDLIDAGGSCPAGVAKGTRYPNGLPNGQYCEDGPVTPCGSDSINAGSGSDVIWGNCGTNAISVGSGKDTVYGYGKGTINVGNGNDTIYAYDTAGAYSIRTGTGTDTVFAQNKVVDTINCGSTHTTVYADKNDKTSGCTVKTTAPPANSLLKPASTKRARTKHKGA
jgi:Ca2+-binding RTX toxin-like protein